MAIASLRMAMVSVLGGGNTFLGPNCDDREWQQAVAYLRITKCRRRRSLFHSKSL